ncbi:hypothetical protein FQN60_007189 [Etheostoma spectabile]|uniref:Uncharacterized protein n=1 Tax=Etheostoma spectabile TaxID=54343 RepID=A0A5J5CCP0_9PERO|nr:hypothetical protein FQN60_007189 [Etheostoma spectabile]
MPGASVPGILRRIFLQNCRMSLQDVSRSFSSTARSAFSWPACRNARRRPTSTAMQSKALWVDEDIQRPLMDAHLRVQRADLLIDIHTALNESGYEQQHQDAVVVSAMTKEGLGHEGALLRLPAGSSALCSPPAANTGRKNQDMSSDPTLLHAQCATAVYLQVSCELAVFLDGLLVIGYGLLRSFNVFLRLSDLRSAQIQHLPQLQLRLSGVLLQLIVHLIYSFLEGGDSTQGHTEADCGGLQTDDVPAAAQKLCVMTTPTCSLSSSMVFSAAVISSCSFSFWLLRESSSTFFFSICFCNFTCSCFSDDDRVSADLPDQGFLQSAILLFQLFHMVTGGSAIRTCEKPQKTQMSSSVSAVVPFSSISCLRISRSMVSSSTFSLSESTSSCKDSALSSAISLSRVAISIASAVSDISSIDSTCGEEEVSSTHALSGRTLTAWEWRVGMTGAARGVWAGVLGSLLLISPAEAEAEPDAAPFPPAGRLGCWINQGEGLVSSTHVTENLGNMDTVTGTSKLQDSDILLPRASDLLLLTGDASPLLTFLSSLLSHSPPLALLIVICQPSLCPAHALHHCAASSLSPYLFPSRPPNAFCFSTRFPLQTDREGRTKCSEGTSTAEVMK